MSLHTYRDLVRRLAQERADFKDLYGFLNESHVYQSPAKFNLINIKSDGCGGQCAIKVVEFDGTLPLLDQLDSFEESPDTCRLLIIENICSETVSILGETFDVDPQFFADHLNNAPWYRIDNIADRIPALPSSQKLHDFLQMRYVDTQTVHENENQFSNPASKVSEGLSWTLFNRRPPDKCDARSFMYPDENTTRIPRKAGKLIPRAREGKHFEPLLCCRRALTVYFKHIGGASGGWLGIILTDPTFRLPPGSLYSIPSPYRSFSRRPSISSKSSAHEPSCCTREILTQQITTRFQDNNALLDAVKTEPFLILGDMYRFVASKWIVMNEYINRELATTEYILEKQEPAFRDLEVYLKDLYIHRRRVTRYHELITEAKEQCSRRGQHSWTAAPHSELALAHTADVEGDFVCLQAKTEKTAQRIDKNISLLTALVAIEAGKQGLDENRGVSRLTLLAAVFLPFSTVAAILSMQGEYAPGQSAFWLFWVVTIPLWVGIVVMSVVYNGGWRMLLLNGRNYV